MIPKKIYHTVLALQFDKNLKVNFNNERDKLCIFLKLEVPLNNPDDLSVVFIYAHAHLELINKPWFYVVDILVIFELVSYDFLQLN